MSPISSDDMSREDGPQASKSSKTIGSIAKLARESLDVGKLLGLKVIGKEEVALKKITSSLKNAKKHVQIKRPIDQSIKM